MKRLPNPTRVDKALRSTLTASKNVLKDLNALAGQVMAKGDYEAASALADKGREIREFQVEVQALQGKWREIRSNRAGRKPRSKTTPLWGYYQPILQALEETGGEASRRDLEPIVERIMRVHFEPGDTDRNARKQERWRTMIQRARKHLIEENWIEIGKGKAWRITSAGRRAARAARAGGEEP